MFTTELALRIGTVVLALLFGLSGAFFTYASIYYPPSATFAIICLIPAGALVWVLPAKRTPQR